MTNYKLVIILFFLMTDSIFAQKVLNLRVDATNALQTFDYLSSKNTSVIDAQSILNLSGTKGMIDHDGLFNKQLNKETFINEITDSLSTTNAFRFDKIRNDLSNIKKTIILLTDSINQIKSRIEANLTPYLNDFDAKPIKVYFILGGNSDGYTSDDSTFYLELHFFGDDIEGIINIITHEVYHILQQRSYTYTEQVYSKLSKQENTIYLLCENIYLEGSASYISNPLTIKNLKKYGLFQQEKYIRNLKKIKESFYLFETLLQMAKSKNANENLLYNIGYGGSWDSPLYFVGYKICEEIEKAYGKYYIKKYISQSPIQLLTDYILLYRQSYKVEHIFSIQTEEIILGLKKTLDRKNYR